MKITNLQQIKDTIRGNIIADNLANQSNGNEQPLHNGIAIVPESTMWRMVTWLHEIILPRIAKSRGVDSEDYTNHVGIRDAVIWAMYVCGQYENLIRKNQRDRQLLGYYVEQNAALEIELQKYSTVEQFISNETALVYRQSIISRAIEILNEKK
jgi:hypothetical protein